MNEVSENIQLLLDDILLFHEELERVFAMEKGIHDQDLENAIISVADGSMSSEQLSDWIRAHVNS